MNDEERNLREIIEKSYTEISSWCAKMAWPGRAPTPPFEAMAARKDAQERLSALGLPKYRQVKNQDGA